MSTLVQLLSKLISDEEFDQYKSMGRARREKNEKQHRKFFSTHETAVTIVECMDDRNGFIAAANLPIGEYCRPIPEVGGRLDLGVTATDEKMDRRTSRFFKRKIKQLIFCCAHYSESGGELNCKGHNFDRNAALAFHVSLARKINHLYESLIIGREQAVVAIPVEQETDTKALRFLAHNFDIDRLGSYGDDYRVDEIKKIRCISTADFIESCNKNSLQLNGNTAKEFLLKAVKELYPGLDEQRAGLIRDIIVNNSFEVLKRKTSGKATNDRDHKEFRVVLGELHWLFPPSNTTLVVSDGIRHPETSAFTALSVMMDSVEAGRVDPQEVRMIVSVAYYADGSPDRTEVNRKRACNRAERLAKDLRIAFDSVMRSERWQKLVIKHFCGSPRLFTIPVLICVFKSESKEDVERVIDVESRFWDEDFAIR